MFQRIYVFFASLLVRAIVAFCTKRGRYVDYVHQTPPSADGYTLDVPRVYMRRYVISGFMTGDAHPNTLLSFTHGPGLWGYAQRAWGEARRRFALNRWHLYLHHMHAPDADPCLHNHPWPWGLSWVLLGGYREERMVTSPVHAEMQTRWLHAPALNALRGTTFHRISEIKKACPYPGKHKYLKNGNLVHDCTAQVGAGSGTFTLFLAGPRRASKPWGYLVPGRGFVGQRERHAEMGASERRAGQ